MTYGNPWQSYQQVATRTAPPGQLVLMLFDGAIRFLNASLAGFDLEDPLEFNLTISNNLIRAQAIINELDLSLNVADGGQLAQTMRALYHYFDRQLQESNIKKERKGIAEVIERISVLRNAWAEMLSTNPAPPGAVGSPERTERELRTLEARG